MTTLRKAISFTLLTLVIAGCGGGGGDDDTNTGNTPSTAGRYSGTYFTTSPAGDNGTIAFDLESDGTVLGTVDSNGGGFNGEENRLTGTLEPSGEFTGQLRTPLGLVPQIVTGVIEIEEDGSVVGNLVARNPVTTGQIGFHVELQEN